MSFIENPPAELKAKWGPLAHVDALERQQILDAPFGEFKPRVARIEKQIKECEKRRKLIEKAKKDWNKSG